jgi:hypothetical protein
MAVIHRRRRAAADAFDADMAGPGYDRCTLCGEPATAFWYGHATVSVCRRCAVEKLPLLIADAVCDERGDGPHAVTRLTAALETVRRQFWKGVAHAVHRAARLAVAERVAVLQPEAEPDAPDAEPEAGRRPRRRVAGATGSIDPDTERLRPQ